MLTLQRHQVEAMTLANEALTVRRIAALLQRYHGDALRRCPVPQDAVVSAGLRRARVYGLSRLDSLAMFVTLMLVVAPGFDRQAAVSALLRAAPDAANDRLLASHATIPTASWDAARSFCDEADWLRETVA